MSSIANPPKAIFIRWSYPCLYNNTQIDNVRDLGIIPIKERLNILHPERIVYCNCKNSTLTLC